MAGNIYKQFLIVGLSIFLATMDSGVQTASSFQNITSSLQEINFTFSTEKPTDVNITVVDAYTSEKKLYLLSEYNKTLYFVTVKNLNHGSLFNVNVNTSNNETFNQSIATKPDAVEGLKVKNRLFTSALINWEKYQPPQNKTAPEYRISNVSKSDSEKLKENYKNVSKLSPGTEYQFFVSVFLYNLYSEERNIPFNTSSVLPPEGINISAVNTSALNVTWKINKTSTIHPDYVEISSKNVTKQCLYQKSFCVIEIGQTPGHNHSLNISSVVENYSSEQELLFHPTKPLPPIVSVSSDNSTLNVTCSPQDSEFDFYIITFNGTNYGPIQKKLPKLPKQNVSFSNLTSKTRYQLKFATLSGTELSEENITMFFTDPSLEQVDIRPEGNSVVVKWTQPNFENCSMCLYNDYNSSCKSILGKNVTFENVQAGMGYLLNVSCYTKWSKPRHVIIPPLPATNINISATSDSIDISWESNFSKSAVEHWFISIDGNTYRISNNTNNYKVQNLTSGTNYSVSIWSSSANNVNSPKETRNITTYPECVTTLSEISFTNSSITLNLSETENSFDHYKFIVQDQNGTVQNMSSQKDVTNVTFFNLTAGVEYNISVKTVIGELQSITCDSVITARTRPNKPIVKCLPTARSISVKLMKGEGNIDGFQVSCSNCSSFKNKNLSSKLNHSLIIPNLIPDEIYLIVVKTFAGELFSENATCNAHTNESAPSEVQELEAKEVGKSVLNVKWNVPKETNGVIRWYIGECNGTEVGTNKKDHQNFNTSDEFYNFTVKPGYSYSITVRAFTVALGKPKTISIISKTYAPGFKPVHTSGMPNISKQIDTTSFTIEFPENPFTDDNGRILNYTVIVATSKKKDNTQSSVLPNWYQFNQNSSINSYQVISNCTNLYKENNTCDSKTIAGRTKRSTERPSVKFKIGRNDCSKVNNSYCNGQLKPDTDYYVKVRAYTQNAFKDTPYSAVIRTKPDRSLPDSAIALAVICPLVTLLLVGLAIYFMRKRIPKTSKVEKDSEQVNMAKYKPTSHPVNLINFKDHVTRMSSDSDFRFAEEYEDLKDIGKNQDLHAAQMMCNRNKNRFANILPYDHSRVKLSSVDDEEGSDYINANYLPGFTSRREYIVTQGPLCSTRDDFWRMVSEQNVHNIVMLTRCVEKLREKCDHYWPESGDPIFYGDVQVAKMHETKTPDWTKTEFKMTIGDKSWNLRHFHFTSWPDFGVPNSPQILVNFVQNVRRSLIKTGPIVIHCSAGVGRSGTFIAVDHCMQHIQENDQVDVLGVVHEMRMHRVLMVQTEQQYIYIHHCLLNALEATENEDIYQNVTINQNGGHDNQAFLEDDEGIHVA